MLPAWDTTTGLTAAMGLLAAERHRPRTGEGQLVKLALSDVAFAMVANLGHIAEAQITHEDRAQVGNDLYGAFGRDFLTRDGRRVMVVAISLKQWQSLVEATRITETSAGDREGAGRRPHKEGDRFAARERDRRVHRAVHRQPHADECARSSTSTACAGARTRRSCSWSTSDPRCSTANPMFAKVDQPGVGRMLDAGVAAGVQRGSLGAAGARTPVWASTPTRSSPRSSA